MVSVRRRSRRARRPAHSVYDDAKEALLEEEAASPSASSKGSSKKSASKRGTSSTKKKTKKRQQQQKRKKKKKDEEDDEPPPPSSPVETEDKDERMQEDAAGNKEDEEDVEMGELAEEEEEEEEEPEEPESSSSEEDDSDDDYKAPSTAAAAARKKKKPSPKAKADANNKPRESTTASARAVTPATGQKKAKAAATAGPKKSRGGNTATRAKSVKAALKGVAKSVLQDEETPETSLFASLVYLLQEGGGGVGRKNDNKTTTKKRTRAGGNKHQQNDDNSPLDEICRKVLQDHDMDPNKAQVELFNLLFRSVGTTYENMIDPQEIDLEVASDDDWEEIITRVTEGMQSTAAEHVLLAANPQGAVAEQHEQQQGKKKAKKAKALVAPLEYRSLYMDFWYRLGMVAMSSGPSIHNKKKANNSGDDSDSEEIEEEDEGGPTAAAAGRFQVEMAREIISRMIEVSGVGQPDIRAAASLAVYQFTQALLDHSADLWGKVQVATRQLNAANKNKSSRGGAGRGRKAEMLQNQIDSHDRTIKEIEEIVITSVIGSVFTKRYKDSNKYIRAETLNAVSRFTVSRPDLLLKSTYLKYFGWMLSDKEAVVRESALMGFLVPFREAEEMGKNKNKKGPRIDKRTMQHAIDNFIKRIADCVIDVDLIVQERAMELLLVLLQEECLDRLDDDAVWGQINMRALEPNTTPQVRCDALKIVTEQLEAFDDAGDGGKLSESKVVERIDGLCKWLAHSLSDGTIPLDEVKYDRVDYVVHSLRAMDDEEQYKALVTNWSAILRALESDDQVSHSESTNRSAAVKQRVMLRYLVCAAELEVSAASTVTAGDEEESCLMDVNMDPDFLCAIAADQRTLDLTTSASSTGAGKSKGRGKNKKTAAKESSQEKLTQALLNELPDLLVTYRVETSVLRDLTTLPLYFDPTVLSLQNRKRDFMKLLSRISDVFVESTDNEVLQNCARVLTSLAQIKNHARTGEALLQLKKTTCSLHDRLLKLLEEKTNLQQLLSKNITDPATSNKDDDGDDEDDDNTSSARDLEVSISLCLRRLVEISKKWDIADLLGRSGGGDAGSDDDEPDYDHDDQELNTLCIAVAAHIARELKAREVAFPDTADDSDDENKEAPQIPDIWVKGDQGIHTYVAETVKEGLNLLLSVTAWRLKREIELIDSKEEDEEDGNKEDNDDDGDPATHIVVQMRDRVLKLLNYCFAQHLVTADYDDNDEVLYSPEHMSFSRALGEHACKVAGDLRVLFPKSFSDADSSLLRACALLDNNDSLLGGFQCVLASNYTKLRENEKEEKDPTIATKILLPMARGLATSWKKGHRREAGSVLSHITGSGQEAHEIVSSTARVMKKIDPIRVLESHMACLQSDFMAWMESEPEDLGDRPTAEDLEAFEHEEQLHIEKFQALEHLASRLSASLGVGKLSANLAPALLGFVGEGVRFAFNNSLEGMEGGESVGARLPFLRVIGKYLSWVRRNKAPANALRQQFNMKELELRGHPEFEELDEFDLETLEQFRKDGGFGPLPAHNPAQDDGDDGSHAKASSAAQSTGRRQPRMSAASFASSSVQSKMTLSPLPEEGLDGETEEDDDDEDDESPSSKRQKIAASARSTRSLMSHGSSTVNPSTRSVMSRSVATNQTQTTIEEGNNESDEEDENESPASSKSS